MCENTYDNMLILPKQQMPDDPKLFPFEELTCFLRREGFCQFGWTHIDLTPSGKKFDITSCQIVPCGPQ